MLEVTGLSVSYGAVRALQGVSLSLGDHGVTTVLGANGAGKTTLLRTISGLLRPDAGSVRCDGADLTTVSVEDIARLGIIQVPEGGGVIKEMTVEDNLRLGHLWRRDAADMRRALAEVNEIFPALHPRRYQLALSLSGGERQMLAIGRALMARPRWLLLDEPSLGLAPRLVTEIMKLVRRLSTERNLAVLLVEQNARIALSIADDAVLLSSGQVVSSGPASSMTEDESVWHAYLGY
ncbi:MAG TPA: ABC transporter ATP-binding protein [Candidatus Solibacter sp.]|jgi:branched-chain amino acid transport system ATP-binding protein|nr:ABC transporter ATP-binding protein [Candidatus Solibacter sp.]